jgi:hypothetical protein
METPGELDLIVEQILQDTAPGGKFNVDLSGAPSTLRAEVLTGLRNRQTPLYSTDSACGPG